MKRLIEQIEKSPTPYVVVTIALLTIWAFAQRFLMDDAFISFRYAKNLADGLGLVWNDGERIEGYTNFLWVILCSLGIKLGVEPEKFSVLLNLPLYIASLLLTYRIARSFLSERYSALFAVILTGVTRSVYAFATSGLETTLQQTEFLALTALLLQAPRNWSSRWALAMCGLLIVMFLTRPDAAIPAAVAFYLIWRQRTEVSVRIWATLLVPLIIAGSLYAGWKLSYFGGLLPNSFHAKVRDLAGIGYGFFFIHQFLLSHLLYPYAIASVWNFKTRKALTGKNNNALVLELMIGVWALYVVLAGGDFMEYRFLIPIISLFYILVLNTLELVEMKALKMALYAGLVVGVLHGNFAMEKLVFGYGIESVRHLKGHLTEPKENWDGIGRKLGQYFGGSDVLIAAGAAGAIPYYSGLKTIDFMGLNDKAIPLEGVPFSNVPGHRVISTLDYLHRRKVNLIIEPINHMWSRQEFAGWAMRPSWRDLTRFFINPDGLVNGKQINHSMLVGIPIDENYILLAWYLTPNATVERVIEEQNWTRVEVTRW